MHVVEQQHAQGPHYVHAQQHANDYESGGHIMSTQDNNNNNNNINNNNERSATSVRSGATDGSHGPEMTRRVHNDNGHQSHVLTHARHVTDQSHRHEREGHYELASRVKSPQNQKHDNNDNMVSDRHMHYGQSNAHLLSSMERVAQHMPATTQQNHHVAAPQQQLQNHVAVPQQQFNNRVREPAHERTYHGDPLSKKPYVDQSRASSVSYLDHTKQVYADHGCSLMEQDSAVRNSREQAQAAREQLQQVYAQSCTDAQQAKHRMFDSVEGQQQYYAVPH